MEYGLLIAGVALISSAGVSIFGHKTNDLVSSVAAVLPGAHADDNGPLVSGKLIETAAVGGAPSATNAIELRSLTLRGAPSTSSGGDAAIHCRRVEWIAALRLR